MVQAAGREGLVSKSNGGFTVLDWAKSVCMQFSISQARRLHETG